MKCYLVNFLFAGLFIADMTKKYKNAKTAAILSKYTPEDIQKLLNSGKFKSEIAKTLGVYVRAFNDYIKEHNLTYKAPCQIKYGKQYKSKKKEQGVIARADSIDQEKAIKCFKAQFEENKQQITLRELKDSYY